MPDLIPVDYDPFGDDGSGGSNAASPASPSPSQSSPQLIPVDHDPFAAAIAAGDPEAAAGIQASQAMAPAVSAAASALKPDFSGAANAFLQGEADLGRTDWSQQPLIGVDKNTGELTGRLPALADVVTSSMGGPVPAGGAGVVLGAGPRIGRMFDYSKLAEVPDVPQFDLPRAVPRNIPDRVQALADPANVARVNQAVEAGIPLGGPEWYGTQPLRQAFIDELGDAGDAAFRRYMDYVAATSPRSKVPENIRNASYYYTLEQQGQPPPQLISQPGTIGSLSEALPSPYGHIAQRLHVQNVQNILDQGGWNVLQNPKPASFAQNLTGNQLPVTVDTHNLRLWGLTDTQGRPVDTPGRAYGFLEQLQQDEAAKMGLSPAQYQASAWLGGGKETGLGSPVEPFLQTFENRVNLTAKKRGEDPLDTLRRFIRGEAPLLSVGGAAAGGGLAAALAAQPGDQQ